jgi:antirestriction protein ArdC
MIHASGHTSRLNREGITQWRTRRGVPVNDAGILDSVRFENSAAYLGSWINKLENDPWFIVSAASQAQRASDFIMGIEHKETLQECQISPEGMPLTWAQ